MIISIERFRLPRYHEIPDVGLYLDQTVKYINRYLEPLGCIEITASMVSNYVKKGYISSPVKKQYDAEQIARLFFITVAKRVISMENITRMFAMQRACYDNATAYDYFCAEMENMLLYTFALKSSPDVIGRTETEAKKMLRSVILAVTQIIYLNCRLELMPYEAQEAADGDDEEAIEEAIE